MRAMLVHGAIRPPPSALEAVAAVVRSVPTPDDDAHLEPAAKGLLGRLGRSRTRDTDLAEAPVAMLEQVEVDRLHLPITGFGNLTTHDANRVAESIATAAAQWHAPKVRFAGGTALDFPGDWSVWAKLTGDLDALAEIARGVTQCVEGLGFFVDRRQFRPMLSVATVTPATTGPYLEALVAALDDFEGESWSPTISLTKETFVGGQPTTIELERIDFPE
jgi:2'-5' RNA ligase